jgi:hypothetical protein
MELIVQMARRKISARSKKSRIYGISFLINASPFSKAYKAA